MTPDEQHQRVVEYVSGHQVFGQVLDDEFLSELRGRWSEPDHEFPEIYCAIAEGNRVNLDVLEKGLELALATKQRDEVIGELRQSGDPNVGTCFELAVLGALVLEFGDQAVTPYPDLGDRRAATL